MFTLIYIPNCAVQLRRSSSNICQHGSPKIQGMHLWLQQINTRGKLQFYQTHGFDVGCFGTHIINMATGGVCNQNYTTSNLDLDHIMKMVEVKQPQLSNRHRTVIPLIYDN